MSAWVRWVSSRCRWGASLAAKFVLLIACITALTLGLAAWYSYYSYQRAYLDHLRSKVEMLAGFVASISPDRIFSHDFSTLYGYVRGLSHTKDLTYAVVIGANGEPMTAYLNKADPTIANAIRAVGSEDIRQVMRYIDRLPDAFSITAPITFNQQEIGRVVVGATRRYVDQELRRILFWDAMGSTLIILLLSAGIFLVFRQNILRPTQALMEGARRVAQGDLRQPIPLASADELGQLARSFNEMMASLEQSNSERSLALADLQVLNRTLERLALYDPLTNLPNRALLQERLTHTLKAAERTKAPFAIMLMDLDRFKEVNDTYGHHTGDQLLIEIGQCLAQSLHSTDTIGRLGGDEFAIVLPDTDGEGAVCVARKLFKELDQPFELQGLKFKVAASLGIALYPQHGADASALLKHADVAMYEAKQGKLGYTLYNKDSDIHSPRRLALLNDLRFAVEAGQMQLYYQPIMDIGTGAVRGVEALARWAHPEKGFIAPDQFIPLIEQTGLIQLFSAWVINEALRQWSAWREQGIETCISVNLSMHNLQDKDFPRQLEALLQKWSVLPHALVLEVTESAMMGDPNRVLQTLNYFRSLGVDVAIDDFGTGYSSLSYLKRMPVNEIKIDRSFVKDVCSDKDDAVIVRSTIDLAHNLGLKVVAEGVEDKEVLSLLTGLSCDLAQGYYFSRPLPPDQIEFFSRPAVARPSKQR